jgi:hypothetical protein
MNAHSIVPVEIPQSPIIKSSVIINVLRVTLGISAEIEVRFLNPDGVIIEIKYLTLSQPDYANWGSDDQFIVDWVFSQLGLLPNTPTIPDTSDSPEIPETPLVVL